MNDQLSNLVGYAKGMQTHNHPTPCEHEIKYCKQCDIVACTKCYKEWKNGCNHTSQGIFNNPLIQPLINPPLNQAWCSSQQLTPCVSNTIIK